MSLQHIVVDNSALIPGYFPEKQTNLYDAKLVNNRSRSLIHAIRTRRVNAFVPPSFFREFLNVAIAKTDRRGGRDPADVQSVREQWQDLLLLPLISLGNESLAWDCCELALEHNCPAADAWYLAAARQAQGTLWMSHDHSDGFAAVATQFVPVQLLADHSPPY